jgi:tripartite-type tricarboxylate transporter receptor subunit TctC
VEEEVVQVKQCLHRLWLTCAATWLAASGLVPAQALAAQTADKFPTRPIRVVIPFPPGGGNDIVGRAIGERLSARVGQQVIVDNRGGGTGVIAAEIVAKAPSDGYTLLLGNSAVLVIQPHLKTRLPYDSIKDFAPILQLVTSPYLLVVHPGLPAASVKEFIALAKSKPGQINYATPSQGSVSHLAAELFSVMAGVRLTQVPYKGTGLAITDLTGGHVSVMFASSASVQSHLGAGRLRALGISTAKRNPGWPHIPTIAEAGLPGYQMVSWNGMLAPRGTPPSIITKLHSDIIMVFRDGDLSQRLSAQGFDPEPSTPQEFAAHIRAELARYGKLIKAANIAAD